MSQPHACILSVLLLLGTPSIGQSGQDRVVEGKPLRSWLRDLKYGNDVEAKSAADVLGRVGPDAHAAVPALLKAMSRGKDVRLACVSALGHLGSTVFDVSARARLYAARRDKDVAIRDRVYWALDKIGADVVPILKKELDNAKLRTWAIQRLGRLGLRAIKTRPALTRILATVVKPLPRGLHNAIERARHARRMAAAVRNRRAAAIALGQIGDCSYGTCKSLSDRLQDPDAAVRRNSVIALAKQGSGCIDWFTKALKLKDDSIVSLAVRVLMRYGPASKGALKSLRRLSVTKRPMPVSRKLAGEALLEIQNAVNLLAEASGPDPERRAKAVRRLVQYGAIAMPVLEKALGGSDAALKIAALEGLFAKASPAPGQSAVPGPHIQVERLIPRVRALALDEDKKVAAAALQAIGRLGRAHGAVQILVAALDSPLNETRIAALQGLRRVRLDQAEANTAIPHLIDALRRKPTCEDAGRILASIGGNAVPALIETLQGADSWARYYAAWTLGLIGPKASEAVGALETLRKTAKDSNLRKEIDIALRHIRGS